MRARLEQARAVLIRGVVWTRDAVLSDAFRRELRSWLQTSEGRAWAAEQRANEERRERELSADLARFQHEPTPEVVAACSPDRKYFIDTSYADDEPTC